jgi:hypothetical protein
MEAANWHDAATALFFGRPDILALLDDELNRAHVYVCADGNHPFESRTWMGKIILGGVGGGKLRMADGGSITHRVHDSWVLGDFLIFESDVEAEVRCAGNHFFFRARQS